MNKESLEYSIMELNIFDKNDNRTFINFETDEITIKKSDDERENHKMYITIKNFLDKNNKHIEESLYLKMNDVENAFHSFKEGELFMYINKLFVHDISSLIIGDNTISITKEVCEENKKGGKFSSTIMKLVSKPIDPDKTKSIFRISSSVSEQEMSKYTEQELSKKFESILMEEYKNYCIKSLTPVFIWKNKEYMLSDLNITKMYM